MKTRFSRFSALGVLPLLAAALVFTATQQSASQTPSPPRMQVREYSADNGIFPNPERGFHQAYQPEGGGMDARQDTPHPPLAAGELRALRSEPEAITLIRDAILIPRKFWSQPISRAYLDELQNNFDAVRTAGLKIAPRFHYDWSLQNRDPDEATINRHLEELKPLLQKNADVIAWVQGGLFGGSGEQNRSDHNYVYFKHPHPTDDSKWQGLSAAGRRILLKELQLLPADRMMNVRYPRLKWDLFDWSTSTALQNALTRQTAYAGSSAARIGFYNDGFMGDEAHYAMFQLQNEAEFMARDSEFVVHEGEISDVGRYKLQKGQVVTDMKKYHFSSLNRGGEGWAEVSATWKRNGDYDEITRRMGYRFRLLKAILPQALRPASTFTLQMEMANDGFARAFNPRAVEIVLRDRQRGAEYFVSVDKGRGNRLWLPGPGETKTLQIEAGIPRAMPTGEYEVFLNLPDPYPSLSRRPEYSIRLANRDVWETSTGFNRLQHTLQIAADCGGQEYSGQSFFAPKKP